MARWVSSCYKSRNHSADLALLDTNMEKDRGNMQTVTYMKVIGRMDVSTVMVSGPS